MSLFGDEPGGLIFIVVLYSVKVALKVRQSGSESPCRWLWRDGVYSKFQDVMHVYVVTPPVVMLSIASLAAIMVGGYRSKGKYRTIAICATVALGMMFAGPIGMGAFPKAYFGIFERFSVLAATGFTAVIGICLFNGFGEREKA